MKMIIKKLLPWVGLAAIIFSALNLWPQQSPIILTFIISTTSLLTFLFVQWLWDKLKRYRQYLAAKPSTPKQTVTSQKTKKTYLITGANRGIGLALVKCLTSDGHTVFATTRNMENASELSLVTDKLTLLDLSQQESIATTAKSLANIHIDIIINNATEAPDTRNFNELDIHAVDTAFATNVSGVLRLTQALLPNLRQKQTRKIINITSDLASFTRPNPCTLYAYQASKAALNMLTVLLHKELSQDGFTCLLIHPGPVKTRLNTGGVISANESARALIEVIENSSAKDGGQWLDYCGKTVPW